MYFLVSTIQLTFTLLSPECVGVHRRINKFLVVTLTGGKLHSAIISHIYTVQYDIMAYFSDWTFADSSDYMIST